jgi:hypothetical protein
MYFPPVKCDSLDCGVGWRPGIHGQLQAKVAYLGTLLGSFFTSGTTMWLLVMVAGRCTDSGLPHDSYRISGTRDRELLM